MLILPLETNYNRFFNEFKTMEKLKDFSNNKIWSDYKEVFLDFEFNPSIEHFDEKNFRLFYSF